MSERTVSLHELSKLLSPFLIDNHGGVSSATISFVFVFVCEYRLCVCVCVHMRMYECMRVSVCVCVCLLNKTGVDWWDGVRCCHNTKCVKNGIHLFTPGGI